MEPASMTCRAHIDNLDEVIGFVEARADRFGLDDKKKFGLLVAVEEAFVNICRYAYQGAEGEVTLACTGDPDGFAVEIVDQGISFDLLSLPDPDITAGILEREIGGLGVAFIRKLTDEVSYRRQGGQNILRMALHVPPGGAEA
ncbi:ATP-binding protein [Desulfobulbus sp.]|uniref:ATP-binding protein n=1 Tax=Desulfobulbus sp. TaxID=895 RepID=UPI0027BA1EC5|nr:ATP-binding protein [Desulfobulbus sp.]